MEQQHAIRYLALSQEELIDAGAFDLQMSIAALEKGLLDFEKGKILFPDKIVQIFDQETQDRINCLPATLLEEGVCGVKWVSVFPQNPRKFGTQNLSAIIVLSSLENGYPVCVMDGTLCSNMRVASMGAVAARKLTREDSEVIGFIGAGEQAKLLNRVFNEWVDQGFAQFPHGKKLKEMVGHTPIEVLTGAALGTLLGFVMPMV